MNDFRKGMRLLKADGIKAALYALVYKLREKASAQSKYDKWIQKYEYQLPSEKADLRQSKSITLICADESLFLNIEKESGDFFAFFYPGDSLKKEWAEMAAAYINRHSEIRFFYTDEDRIQGGKRTEPVFKPDWSPDTYLSYDYAGGLLLMERNLALEALHILIRNNPDAVESYGCGSLYALGLCATELITEKEIGHFKRVLYHRDSVFKIPGENLMNIKTDLIKRRGLEASLESENKSGEVRIVYTLTEETFISIIIPSKDQPDMLASCVESAEKYTAYDNYEWIIIDNGSTAENRSRYEQIAAEASHSCRYIYEPMEFNFARMCNLGAESAKGSCLIFLNDDIEFSEDCSRWLERIAAQAMQPSTGAVGAKLLYPNSTIIQHVGIVNFRRGATHLFRGSDDLKVLPFYKNCLDTNSAMVTGAVMAVERKKFDEVGGFNEDIKVTYNDVDLCLKLLEKGYYNVVRTDAVAFHHESFARGEDAEDENKYRRCLLERERVFGLHKSFRGLDPYYHPYLSQNDTTAGVTTVYLPVISRAKKVYTGLETASPEALKFRIDSIEADEWLYIRGYAFSEKLGKEKVSIIFKGEHSYKFDTKAFFDHTMTPLHNDGKSYAFCGFEAMIRYLELPMDNYKICIKIGNLVAETGENCLTFKNI